MKLLIVLIVLLGFQSQANAKEILFTCVTEFPTTSYQLEKKDGAYELLVVHHNGTKYMPIFSGDITPNDLPYLTKLAEELPKMGEVARIPFKEDECKQSGNLWNCYGKNPTRVGGLDVQRVSLQMGQFKKDYEGYKWETTKTSLSFRMSNTVSYMMSMEYQPWECKFH